VVLEAYEGYWRTVPHIKRPDHEGCAVRAPTRSGHAEARRGDIAMAVEVPSPKRCSGNLASPLVDTRAWDPVDRVTEQWDPRQWWPISACVWR